MTFGNNTVGPAYTVDFALTDEVCSFEEKMDCTSVLGFACNQQPSIALYLATRRSHISWGGPPRLHRGIYA